jgi:LacI family transcriptional regulator
MRVMQAALELDYTPSRLARSLVTGSTGNVGVILPDITNPFYTSFLAGLEAALGAQDIGVLIGDSGENREREHRLVQRMSTQVDGLVLASSRLSDDQIVNATSRRPVVLANRMLEQSTDLPKRLGQVVIDVHPGFTAAARHLHDLGHRRVTYIDGPPQSWSGGQKRATLSLACEELGIPLEIVGTTRADFGAGRAAARAIAGQAERYGSTAIIAFNDQMALGVLSGCRESGIAVPGDISLVGCDDSLEEGLAWPALTTVGSSARALGELAALKILSPSSQETGRIPTTLIVRESTAQPRPQPVLHTP